MTINNKYFLYAGLSLLFISILVRWLGAPYAVFIPLFSLAILMKGIFLVNIFRTKEFRMTLWLTLILIGVVLILISMLFKYLYPIPLLRNIFFYGALLFKISGLGLLIFKR